MPVVHTKESCVFLSTKVKLHCVSIFHAFLHIVLLKVLFMIQTLECCTNKAKHTHTHTYTHIHYLVILTHVNNVCTCPRYRHACVFVCVRNVSMVCVKNVSMVCACVCMRLRMSVYMYVNSLCMNTYVFFNVPGRACVSVQCLC